MSMSGDDAYVLAMDYVDETLKGGGALKGDDGKSAYQSWLDLGNNGTEEDFINSLKGEKGQVGEKGETGNDGKSSYEIWLDNGNVGTEQDFLDSLKGEGTDGFSPVITENSNNTYEDYRLDIETKESKFTTPNLKADISINIAEHNTSPDSHNDIRIFLNELNNRLNALANSDDETLDEMKEVVAYIKDNRSLIESITTTKVNVADIIDNLITNVSNKPLSASQGVVIKNLIDTLQAELTAHANNADIHVTPNDKTNWNNATDKINNLEISGGNLYVGTKHFTGNKWEIDTLSSWENDSTSYKGFSVKKRWGAWGGLSQEIQVKSGEIYTFSAYVKHEDSNGKCMFIYNQGSKGTTTATIIKSNVDNSEGFNFIDWTRVYFTIKADGDGTLYLTIENINEYYLYICGIKLEKGNVATDWTPALEDKIEIADVNGLQTIADNNQFTGFNSTQQGWYRFAEYIGSMSQIQGSSSNSCEIIIKRNYASVWNEEHKLLLQSRFQQQKFVSIYNNSNENSHIITKIRYVHTSDRAYLDVYHSSNSANWVTVTLNNGKDILSTWQAISSPYLVAESTEGETVSTVFDIPANANPVTDLDLTIDAIQGLRAELDELRSLITNS